MFRRLLLASALIAMVGFAFAQTTFTIAPTKAPTAQDEIAKGDTSASVTQTVQLILPQATALHLDASTLVFDLTSLDGPDWANRAKGNNQEAQDVAFPACVTAISGDITSRLDSNFWNQTQTMPGGTRYEAKETDWPNITVTGAAVNTYPPIRLDPNGELIENSKNYFVCYQSFIIQTFSNFKYWDLQVTRNDTTSQPIEHLYVQGNTCSDFGTPTGLYALNNESTVHLIPRNLNAGTTGMQVIKPNSKCNYNDKSWLDVLGVLAVKVNSDYYGTSTANLTYTLVSSDNQF